MGRLKVQKNYTVLKVGAFEEAAKQLAEATETINAVHAKLLESKKKELEVPHFANFAEALRRINVFSSGCQQAFQAAALRDQVK